MFYRIKYVFLWTSHPSLNCMRYLRGFVSDEILGSCTPHSSNSVQSIRNQNGTLSEEDGGQPLSSRKWIPEVSGALILWNVNRECSFLFGRTCFTAKFKSERRRKETKLFRYTIPLSGSGVIYIWKKRSPKREWRKRRRFRKETMGTCENENPSVKSH